MTARGNGRHLLQTAKSNTQPTQQSITTVVNFNIDNGG